MKTCRQCKPVLLASMGPDYFGAAQICIVTVLTLSTICLFSVGTISMIKYFALEVSRPPLVTGHPLTLLTLGPQPTALLIELCRHTKPLLAAIKHLKKNLREPESLETSGSNNTSGIDAGGSGDGLDGSENEDNDEEEV